MADSFSVVRPEPDVISQRGHGDDKDAIHTDTGYYKGGIFRKYFCCHLILTGEFEKKASGNVVLAVCVQRDR